MNHIVQTIIDFISNYGYWSIGIAMFLDSANIPIPSEITLPFGGYLASISKLNLTAIIIVSTVTTTLGSILNYYFGFFGGRPLLIKYGKYFLLSKKDFDLGIKWFNKYGNWAVFFGRLIPGVRTFISFPAGVAKIKLGAFIVYTFIGSLLWCSLLTYIGFVLGQNWEKIEVYFEEFHIIIITAFVLLGIIYIWHKIKEFKENP